MYTSGTHVLKTLRRFIPSESIRFEQALQVAEVQATHLATLLDAPPGELNEAHLRKLPRIQVVAADLPVSGSSYWNGSTWIIALADYDSRRRQRFTLFHEFKHIIDHGAGSRLYTGTAHHSPYAQAETACDFFAGCALVPRSDLLDALAAGHQTIDELAELFDVDQEAIQVRLRQAGLTSELIAMLHASGAFQQGQIGPLASDLAPRRTHPRQESRQSDERTAA